MAFDLLVTVTHKYVTQNGEVRTGVVKNADVRLLRLNQLRVSPESGEGTRSRVRPVETEEYLPISKPVQTDSSGAAKFTDIEAGMYRAECTAFGRVPKHIEFSASTGSVNIELDLGVHLTTQAYTGEGNQLLPTLRGMVGKHLVLKVESSVNDRISAVRWIQPRAAGLNELSATHAELIFAKPGVATLEGSLVDNVANSAGNFAEAQIQADISVSEPEVHMIGGRVGVTLGRTASEPTLDQALWIAIRNRTRAISFGPYREFIDGVLGWKEAEKVPNAAIQKRLDDLGSHMHGVNAYLLLKTATEIFLLLECGVRISNGSMERRRLFDSDDEASRLGGDPARYGDYVSPTYVSSKLRQYLGDPPQLPYITRVVSAAFPDLERGCWPSDRVFTSRINEPCLIELIWSYWMDEGMLSQTMNAISRRFQNVRSEGTRDPLASVELDPLRPVNNLIWGHIQDEINRTSVRRRAYEYSHQYGLSLYGKATGGVRPADNRSKFLEAFHNLLKEAADFHDRDLNTTLIADGYRLLNSLKEVHLILAQGAHNQFGDLPWAARTEMMLTQYMLARPEIREYLQSRAMVPYKEAWMPQVDTMKTLQGWSDVTVTHFRDLAVYGEQLLLSVRYGDWIDVDNEDPAKNWARYWRPEIQSYIHAYRAVTGVDVTTSDVPDATMPAIHLQRRLAAQQRQRT